MKRFLALVIAAALQTPAHAQLQPLQLPQIPNPFQFLGGLLSPKANELSKLIDQRKLREADKFYGEQERYFKENASTHGELVKKLAALLNEDYRARLEKSQADLMTASSGAYEQRAVAIQAARSLQDEYGTYAVFQDQANRSAEFQALVESLRRTDAALAANAWLEFQRFDHAKNFFDVYPLKLDEKEFGISNGPQLVAWANTFTIDQAKTISAAYPKLLASNEAFKAAIGRRFFANSIGQSGPGSLAAVLEALEAARKAGIEVKDLPNTRIAIVEVTSKTLLKEGQIEFPVSLDIDLPFQVKKQDVDSIAEAAGEGLDYVIAIDVAQANVSRRVLGKSDSESQFVTGTRPEFNPEYDVARSRVMEAQNGLVNAQSQPTYGPAAAFLQGIAIGAWRNRLEEARNAMGRTPSQLNKDVFERYKYSVSEVDASRKLTANYYVIDRNRSSYYKGTVDVSQNKTFRIAYNLNEKDPEKGTILGRFATEDDLAKYEQQPMMLSTSTLMQDFLKNQGQMRPLTSLQALRQEMVSDKNKALTAYKTRQFDAKPVNDSRFDSVVVVLNPQGSLGAGFYITPDLVLTNFHVVEGAKFVEMRLYNGLETFGKVVKSDVRLDLALVKVEARGKPVAFFPGQNLELGSTVEAIGHPKGLSYSLTRGVISAVRKRPSIYAVGGKDVMFVQTDAAINPGNSGGPLFLGEKVIGVNNNKMVRGAEGLGFAVHYSEVQDFVSEVLK